MLLLCAAHLSWNISSWFSTLQSNAVSILHVVLNPKFSTVKSFSPKLAMLSSQSLGFVLCGPLCSWNDVYWCNKINFCWMVAYRVEKSFKNLELFFWFTNYPQKPTYWFVCPLHIPEKAIYRFCTQGTWELQLALYCSCYSRAKEVWMR